MLVDIKYSALLRVTDTPFTRYNRLYNQFDNRLYRVYAA